MDARGLVETLRRTAAGEVRADPGTRELYATDASLYRRLPVAALRAAEVGDLEAAVAACREHGVPLTMRGRRDESGGPDRRLRARRRLLRPAGGQRSTRWRGPRRSSPASCWTQLNAAAAEHGLAFGPDVATANRATLGGMIANNSAGARSIAYGLTADHVDRARRRACRRDPSAHPSGRGRHPPPSRRRARSPSMLAPPRLLRRVSGYNLDALRGRRTRLAAGAVRLGGDAGGHARARRCGSWSVRPRGGLP